MHKFFFLIMILMAMGCGKESSRIKQDHRVAHVENERLESKQDADGDGIVDSLDDFPYVANVPAVFSFQIQSFNISFMSKGSKARSLFLKTNQPYAEKLEEELLGIIGEDYARNFNLWDYGSSFYISSRADNESIHEAMKEVKDIDISGINSLELSFSTKISFDFENIKSINNVQFRVLMVDSIKAEITEIEDIRINEEFTPMGEKWINLSFRLKKEDLSNVLNRIINGEIRFGFGAIDCLIENKNSFSVLLSNVKRKTIEISGNFFAEYESKFVSSDKVDSVEKALGFLVESGFSIDSITEWSNGGEITINTFDGKETLYYILKTGSSNGIRSKVFPGERIIFLKKKPLVNSKKIINSHGTLTGNFKEVFSNNPQRRDGAVEVFFSGLNFSGVRYNREATFKTVNFCNIGGKIQAGVVEYKKLNYQRIELDLKDESSINYFLEKIILNYGQGEVSFKSYNLPYTHGSYRVINDGLVISVPIDSKSRGVLNKIFVRGDNIDLDTSDSGLVCRCPGAGFIQCPFDIVNSSKKEIINFTDNFQFYFSAFL